jgi:hypothetical protein
MEYRNLKVKLNDKQRIERLASVCKLDQSELITVLLDFLDANDITLKLGDTVIQITHAKKEGQVHD